MGGKLFKSAVVVSAMTFLSRILGFIRDVVFARYFGADAGMDAFLIAFKIPNFMRRLFAEGAFSQAFVPVLGEYKETKEHGEVKRLVDDVAGTLGGWLFIITLLGVIGAPVLITIFAPGYLDDPQQFDLTTNLLRITFPYILFISLVAFAGGILNSYGKFAAPAFTPVLLNISLISCAVWLAPEFEQPVYALAIGVFIAGVAQLLFQFPFLLKLKLLPRPRVNRKDEGVSRILTLMLPAIFGASVAQINLLLDTLIASLLVAGSISWLYYADRLMEFPLGILGVALATVILPSLSQSHANASSEKFSQTLDYALRWVLYLGVPAAVGLFILAGPMIATLFMSDVFTAADVTMASWSLMAYSLGLMGFILVKVLVPGFFSRQDTKTPVRIGIIALVVNMVFNIVIVVPWYLEGYSGAHTGLAIATSISAFVNAYLLYRGLRREGVYQPGRGWGGVWLRIIVANIVMAVVLTQRSPAMADWLIMDGWDRASQLLQVIAVSAAAYFAALFITGARPKEFLRPKIDS